MAREPLRKYQTELSRYGLGLGGLGFNPMRERTVFAEEGPASALGADSLANKQLQSIMSRGVPREEAIKGLGLGSLPIGGPTDMSKISDIAKAYAEVVETARPESSSTLPSVDDILAADPSVFALEGGERIAPRPKPQVKSPDDIIAQQQIAAAEKEMQAKERADSAIDAKMNKDAIAGLLGDSGSPDKTAAVEDAFLGGMSEYYKALAQDVPEVGDRKELLQKYMQEFSEATGIPVEGKIDKSQALMALGLGLMQNRAGKGFNVGRMLSSVGEAGQAAMPYLTKAKDEAKQARIAAGKYALQKIESDESAVDAIKSANRALYNDLALENMKHKNEIEKEILKAKLEGNESKKIEALKSVGDLKVRIGSQDIILKRGANVEDEGRVVWQDPVGDAKNIATAYRKTTGGLNSVARMNELLDLMAVEAEGQIGGTAVQGLLDKAKEVAVSVGMDLGPYTGGEDVSPRVQYEKLSNALLANFKRYLTSETGNGISTYDVQQIQAALGKFSTFDDIKGAKMALNEIMPMFTHSLTVLEPLVEDFSDRNQYRAGVAGDEQYDDVMSFFGREFGKTSLIQPTQVTRDDGTVVTEYDVSY